MSARPRVFFALWPGDEVRHQLFHWQTQNLPSGVSRLHRDDLHLTLHFLGEVEPPRIEVLKRLADSLRLVAFELVLDRIGYWPRPQVLWAGPSAIPVALVDLHARLGERLREADFGTESREYRPHVTLARKVRQPLQVGPLVPLSWPVTELALLESRPGSAPNYRPLARWTVR